MLVLSREVDEAVLIGDSISVTVVSINPDCATLFVRYRDENQRVEQKLALEIDDRLEITDDIYVSVVDIRENKIRIAIVAPKSMAVHRKEVYEAVRNKNQAVAEKLSGTLKLSVGEILLIGDHLELTFALTDSTERTMRSRGQVVGGARDGEPFERADPISVGSVLDFGTLVRACVMEMTVDSIGLKIENPTHMICRIKK